MDQGGGAIVNFKIYLFGGRSYREFQNQLFWRAERWARVENTPQIDPRRAGMGSFCLAWAGRWGPGRALGCRTGRKAEKVKNDGSETLICYTE
jgi:hypothetical protein